MESSKVDIFSLLWTEIDFDDHPVHGGHGALPEGEVGITYNDKCIHVNDERIILTLAQSNNIVKSNPESLYIEITNSSGLSLKQHIIALTEQSETISEPPERVHSATLPRSWIPLKLADSPQFANFLSASLMKVGENQSWRADLWDWREKIAQIIPDWTWHLEFGNKSDRLGWYIRAPGNTLFTIFLGWGWLQDDKSDQHGFFLFERAPLGELDREDESKPNLADHDRTQHLFSDDGPLKLLTDKLRNGDIDLPHTEIVHFDSGLWPIVIGRSPSGWSGDDVGTWFREILLLLKPSLDYVSMT